MPDTCDDTIRKAREAIDRVAECEAEAAAARAQRDEAVATLHHDHAMTVPAIHRATGMTRSLIRVVLRSTPSGQRR